MIDGEKQRRKKRKNGRLQPEQSWRYVDYLTTQSAGHPERRVVKKNVEKIVLKEMCAETQVTYSY